MVIWLVLFGVVLAGIAIDFLRILNSLDDLTATTLRELSPAAVKDAGDEARHTWFPINVVLVLVAVVIRSVLGRARATHEAGAADE